MKPTTVDEYIAAAPKETQERLRLVRKVIKKTAPDAEEKLSYGMPYYGYKGRLAYFGFAKGHIGLYIPPPVIQDHAKELEGYETATATVRFPLNQELPLTLIEKLVKARVVHNEHTTRK